MTSSSLPSSAAAAAASMATLTDGPYATTVAVVPGRTTCELKMDGTVAAVSTSAFNAPEWYSRFGSKNRIGSSDLMACWMPQYASTALDTETTFRPGTC